MELGAPAFWSFWLEMRNGIVGINAMKSVLEITWLSGTDDVRYFVFPCLGAFFFPGAYSIS